MKILLTTDGSDCTRRSARYLARHLADLAAAPEVHMLYVHPPLPYPRAALALGRKALDDFYAGEAHEALTVATKVLDKARIPYRASFRIGDIVEEIGGYVGEAKIDLIVMGSHGHGALASMALGSVTAKVLAGLKTPVLIVR